MLAGCHWCEQQLHEDPKGIIVPLLINPFWDGLHRLSRENTTGTLLSPMPACVRIEATDLPLQLASRNFQDEQSRFSAEFSGLFSLFIISAALLFIT